LQPASELFEGICGRVGLAEFSAFVTFAEFRNVLHDGDVRRFLILL